MQKTKGIPGLPETIKNRIVRGFEEKLRNTHNDEIYLTEITGCQYKSWIRRKLEEVTGEPPLEIAYPLFRGNVWDRGMAVYFDEEQIEIAMEIEDEQYGKFVLKGRADGIIEAEELVIEVKNSAGKDQYYPYEGHKKQVFFYTEALRKQRGKKYKPVIIYANDRDIFTIKFDDEPDLDTQLKQNFEEIIEKAKEFRRSLIEDRAPEKKISGLCHRCPISFICKSGVIQNTEGVETFKKDLLVLLNGAK